MPSATPLERTVTRFVCPHCSRGFSKRSRAMTHMAACLRDPATRACKTCANYEPSDDPWDFSPSCAAGYISTEKPDGTPRRDCLRWRLDA